MTVVRPVRGFTLIELMVVLTIMGITAFLVFPKVEGAFSSVYLRSSARRLVGMIRYAQNQAMTTGQEYRVYYDLDKEDYWISEEEKGDFRKIKTDLGGERRLLPGVIFEDVVTPGKGKQTAGSAYTEFSPQGGVERTTLHLRDRKGEQISLSLRGLAGKVEIADGYRE